MNETTKGEDGGLTRDTGEGAGTNATGSSGVWQLFKERRSRGALYGTASYWDARASARRGMARSLWPSNAYNELWDERQRALLKRTLGDLEGRLVLDVGCGTGRMTCFLAERCGVRQAVGVDFSPSTLEGARHEAGALASSGLVRFEQADVVRGLGLPSANTFDDALALGCLSVACADRASLEAALTNIAKMVRKRGRVLLLEPIHRSPLLRRVLDLGLEEWIACANHAGLALVQADRMGFVPTRLVLSVRDLPHAAGPVLRWAFAAGERCLDRAPWLAPLADYKLLLFTRTV